MIGERKLDRDAQRTAGCLARRWPSALARMVLVVACAFPLAGSGVASAAEAEETQASVPYTGPLSMTDEEVAALIQRLGLTLTDKPVRELVKGWRKPKKAIVFAERSPQWIPWLRTAAPDLKIFVVERGMPRPLTKEFLAQVADVDIQIGGSCSKDLLAAEKKLQFIQSSHVGVEGCFTGDVPKRLLDGDVIMANQKRAYGGPIATHAIAMMLALQRGLDLYVRMNDAEQFVPTPYRLRFPQGQTMLVVGLGGLGTDVAKVAHKFDMKIIGTRNSSREKPDFVDYVGLANELPDLIGKADVVVAAVPLTDQTRKLFNADMFGRMKKGALFINVARGGLVDSAALVAALKSGQVGGAGLDVTDPEPLQKGDPLWHAPNIIITPHMSAHFSSAGDGVERLGNETIEAWAVMRENVRRYIAGDQIYSIVDTKVGY
jgi:phosphoglycerate dehydrogenase-like enzyme